MIKSLEKPRTKERVAMLHNHVYVPTFLAELNVFLYDILSKGVHELCEQEYLPYYDTLRDAIYSYLKKSRHGEKRKIESNYKK